VLFVPQNRRQPVSLFALQRRNNRGGSWGRIEMVVMTLCG